MRCKAKENEISLSKSESEFSNSDSASSSAVLKFLNASPACSLTTSDESEVFLEAEHEEK